tara:strand:+ start:49290 stop:50705 length:1416 start_codon:yes stop_codon:yes gene_type:complete
MRIEKNISYLLSTSFMQFVPFVFLLFVIRILNKDTYGSYVLALSFAAIISSFFSLSVQLVFEKEFFAIEEKTKEFPLLISFSLIFIISNILGVFFTGSLSDKVYQMIFNESLPENIILLAYLTTVIANLKALIFLYIRNIQKHESYLFFTITDVLVCYVSMSVSVFFYRNIESLMISQVIANLLILLCFLLKYRLPIKTLELGLRMRQVLRSLPLLPRNIVSVLQGRLDSILIGRYVGVADTAVFAVGNKLGGTCFNYMNSLENAYVPQVLELMNKGPEESSRVRDIFNPYLFLSLFLCMLLGVFANEAIRTFFTNDYYQAIHLVKVISFYYALLFWGKTRQLLFSGKYSTISLITSIRAILGVVISLYAIKFYGFWGAVWGMIIAQFLVQPFFIYYSQKQYFIPWQWLRIIYLYLLLLTGLIGAYILEESGMNLFFALPLKLMICFIYLLAGKQIGFIKTLNLKKLSSNF